MSKKKFKSSEVLAVAMSLLMDSGAKTCCSAIGRAVRQLTGDPPEKTKKGKNKESMPKHPLYRQAVGYIERFRPTELEADVSHRKVLLKPTAKGQRTWWRTPSHPGVYAHKTERLIALSWAFLDAKKARD